ncbi:carbohydrate-binding domain-containing protein [Candidatus Omnitrophota bacterium]
MTNQRISNGVLLFLFLVTTTAVILPLLAELESGKAQRLESQYRWRKARDSYQRAAKLNPLNAKYSADAAEFLLRQSRYKEEKSALLQEAKVLLKRASLLNPRYAQNKYLLGEVHLLLGETQEAADSFLKAIERDPYNLRMNYLIGYHLLSNWSELNQISKDFVVERIRYVLKHRPYDAQHLYSASMYYANDFSLLEKSTPSTYAACSELYAYVVKNGLWKFRKKYNFFCDMCWQNEKPDEFKHFRNIQKKNIEAIKETGKNARDVIAYKDWIGTSDIGDHKYIDGAMYWTGTVRAPIRVPSGDITLIIAARGVPADDIFPYVTIDLDDKEIAEVSIKSGEWKEYAFHVDTNGGIKVISISFLNDGRSRDNQEDRNVFIGDTRVEVNQQSGL